MTKPIIHGKRRALSASAVLDAVASDLLQIKQEDALSFKDIGRVLGKSEDQASKYCDGTAEMGLTAYAFGKAQWNGRFTGTLDSLILDSRGHLTSDRCKATVIGRALAEILEALEDDDEASAKEVRERRKALEDAKHAIEGFLDKLRVRAA
jgi:hypothetical protein